MSVEAQAVLACTVWVAFWWITEAVPIPVTSLLPIIILPLSGGSGLDSTTSAYGNPVVFLFLGGFVLALAMEKWDLHKRIALTIILTVGADKSRLVLGFMLATAFLSMWISNTATAMMMLPIGMAVVKQFFSKQETALKKDNLLGKVLMLSIAYSASIGGLATIIGTPGNAIFVAVAGQTLGLQVSFYSWIKMAFPLMVLLLLLCWFYLVRIAFPLHRVKEEVGSRKIIQEQLNALGGISSEEMWVGAVFVCTGLCWITRSLFLNKFLPALDDSMIAMGSILLLFIIPARSKGNKEALLTWQIAEKLPWGILLLFGGGLAIASGFKESGLAAWIGGEMSLLQTVSPFVIILCIVAVINFLTEVTSNTATATMMLPVMASLAVAVNIHPFGPMVAACLASSCAFMLPVATPPNAVVFGSEYISMKDMVKAGFWLNIISIVVITLYLYFLLPVFWNINL